MKTLLKQITSEILIKEIKILAKEIYKQLHVQLS